MSDQSNIDPPPPSETPPETQPESESHESPALSPPTHPEAGPSSRDASASGSSGSRSDPDRSPSAASEPVKTVDPNLPDVSEAALESIQDVPDEQKARILRRHLPSPDTRELENESERERAEGPSDEPDPENPSYHHLTAGDIVHDLYKWEERARTASFKRSASFDATDHASEASTDPVLDIRNIREPGGFRRNFLRRRAVEEGREHGPLTRSFVDFLSLYGGFAGEDLEDLEGFEEEDEETARADIEARPSETAPLLKRPTGRHRRKPSGGPPIKGDASVTQAVLMVCHLFHYFKNHGSLTLDLSVAPQGFRGDRNPFSRSSVIPFLFVSLGISCSPNACYPDSTTVDFCSPS
jgi:proton-coupled amino acid transporter